MSAAQYRQQPRPILPRALILAGLGIAAVVIAVLYFTGGGGAPSVDEIRLSQHRTDDDRLALTTTSIQVTFSEPPRQATAEAAFRIEPPVAGTFSWSDRTMTFRPSARLPLDTAFRAWIDAGVEDEDGNRMGNPSDALEFRTVGPPGVAATEPADGATGVPLDAMLVIEFEGLMDTAQVEAALRVRPAFEFELFWSAERLTMVPAQRLREGTRYTITIRAQATDGTGVPLGAPYRFSFTTALSPLDATGLVPADGSHGVALTTPVAVLFDRAIDPASVGDTTLRIEPEVAGSLEVVAAPGAAGMRDPTASILRFEPAEPLSPDTTYRVVLGAGLRAVDGATRAGPTEWSFTTGSPLSSLGNQVIFLSDRAGIANLWAMNPDGSAQRQVSAELSPVIEYAVSPDGRSVVLADGAILVLQRADGSDRSVLTSDDHLEYDPAWAPDGARFAFGRADRATGRGEGIWTRADDGGDGARLELPDELRPSPQPTPDDAAGVLLRAPRYSPDGAALAYVDLAGRVGVVELPRGRLSSAAWVAVGPPVWLRDSTAVLVPGVDAGLLTRPAGGQPFEPLHPGTLGLDDASLRALTLGFLDRGAIDVTPLTTLGPAGQVEVNRDAMLYLQVDPAAGGSSGSLWLATNLANLAPDRQLLSDGGAALTSAGFGPVPGSAVAARQGGGVWLVDTETGDGVRLTRDGWAPRWLP